MDELSRLLIKARDGDRRALAAFVRRTQPAIWRFCAHVVGPSDADDATQETYLAAWRALPSYRGEASARTWLFVIARRSADRVGRRHRRWRELADHLPAPSPASQPGLAMELEDGLSRLDSDRRVALVLTQVIGLSYKEAAEVCECAVGTIRSRVARARDELLEHLARSEPLSGRASS
ncbi:MAG TPA: sigma-70 family RNA polymerase sigma factor [Acidimicrobiales bacterium]